MSQIYLAGRVPCNRQQRHEHPSAFCHLIEKGPAPPIALITSFSIIVRLRCMRKCSGQIAVQQFLSAEF